MKVKKTKENKKIKWKVLIVSLIVVFLVALIGSRFTVIDSYYDSVKPSITPPNWVFPIAWSILFFLIAISLYFAWINGKNKLQIGIFYLINFILNVTWSYFYFTLKNPLYAFIDLVLLWFSILSLIILNWKISRKAAWLLLPYLIWVSFAGVLNLLTILG